MEFISLRKSELKDRGTVYLVVYYGETIYKTKCNPLVGAKVIIDGKEYIVKGVESFAIETISNGQQIGLLV